MCLGVEGRSFGASPSLLPGTCLPAPTPVWLSSRVMADDWAEETILKVDDEKRLVFGWAYVSRTPTGSVIVDKQGDFIDSDVELEKMAYDFVVDSRTGDVMHNEKRVATLVESVVFTTEKVEKMGLPPGVIPTAWWIGMRVEDDATWDLVKKGHLKAWSIGGRGTRQHVESI